MRAVSGELPDEPGIDGAEGELAALGAQPRAGNIVEEPRDLGAAEIRIDHQTGFFMDDLLATVPLQLCTKICAAPILPDDRVVDRLAALPVPKDGGFALVGDADRRQLLQRDARLA